MGHTVEAYNKSLLEEDTDKELRSSKKHRCSPPSPDPQSDAHPDLAPAPKKAAKRRAAKGDELQRDHSAHSRGGGVLLLPRGAGSIPAGTKEEKSSRFRCSSPPPPQTTTPDELVEGKRRIREGGFEYEPPREFQEAEDSFERHKCRAPSWSRHPELRGVATAVEVPPPPPPKSPAPAVPAGGPSSAPSQNNYIRRQNSSYILPPAPAPPRNYISDDNDRKAPCPTYIPENNPKIDISSPSSSSSSSSEDEDKPARRPKQQQQQHGNRRDPSGPNYDRQAPYPNYIPRKRSQYRYVHLTLLLRGRGQGRKVCPSFCATARHRQRHHQRHHQRHCQRPELQSS